MHVHTHEPGSIPGFDGVIITIINWQDMLQNYERYELKVHEFTVNLPELHARQPAGLPRILRPTRGQIFSRVAISGRHLPADL